MFKVHLRLGSRLQAVVWMDSAPTADGYQVWGHFVVDESRSAAPDAYARRSLRRRSVSNDYTAVTEAMRQGFARLFAALDKVKRPSESARA